MSDPTSEEMEKARLIHDGLVSHGTPEERPHGCLGCRIVAQALHSHAEEAVKAALPVASAGTVYNCMCRDEHHEVLFSSTGWNRELCPVCSQRGGGGGLDREAEIGLAVQEAVKARDAEWARSLGLDFVGSPPSPELATGGRTLGEAVKAATEELRADLQAWRRDVITQGRVLQQERQAREKAEREREDARDLVAEVAHGVTHYAGCMSEQPCVRCQRDQLKAEVERLKARPDHPKIADPCPSCGWHGSLFIGSSGHLTCAVLGCKEPGVTRAHEKALTQARREGAEGGAEGMRQALASLVISKDDHQWKQEAGTARQITWVIRDAINLFALPIDPPKTETSCSTCRTKAAGLPVPGYPHDEGCPLRRPDPPKASAPKDGDEVRTRKGRVCTEPGFVIEPDEDQPKAGADEERTARIFARWDGALKRMEDAQEEKPKEPIPHEFTPWIEGQDHCRMMVGAGQFCYRPAADHLPKEPGPLGHAHLGASGEACIKEIGFRDYCGKPEADHLPKEKP